MPSTGREAGGGEWLTRGDIGAIYANATGAEEKNIASKMWE